MLQADKQFVRAIILGLVLIAGSVQAQASYFCSITEMVIHDDCCCADFDVDDTMAADNGPCCDKSVDLVVDSVADQAQPSAKAIQFESDVDPPATLAHDIDDAYPSLSNLSASGDDIAGIPPIAGSATYLITQRLRL